MSNKDITIKMLTSEEILEQYSDIKPEIDKALEHSSGEWTSTQIITACISDPKAFHIWYVYDGKERIARASTRFIQYNNFTALHVITVGGKSNGKMTEWTEVFIELLKEYPQLDCVECTGRRGLLKPLIKAGWSERHTTIRKSLKEGFDV